MIRILNISSENNPNFQRRSPHIRAFCTICFQRLLIEEATRLAEKVLIAFAINNCATENTRLKRSALTHTRLHRILKNDAQNTYYNEVFVVH